MLLHKEPSKTPGTEGICTHTHTHPTSFRIDKPRVFWVHVIGPNGEGAQAAIPCSAVEGAH